MLTHRGVFLCARFFTLHPFSIKNSQAGYFLRASVVNVSQKMQLLATIANIQIL
jgi:hypothetical protein